jgi:hypothetical protein
MKSTKLGDLKEGDFFKFIDEMDYFPTVINTFKNSKGKECTYFSEVGGYVLTHKERKDRLVVKVKG